MRKLPGYPRIGKLSGSTWAAAPGRPERGMGEATQGLWRRADGVPMGARESRREHGSPDGSTMEGMTGIEPA